MKELSAFKDIHKGQDIYVVGSGYSAEYIDSAYFKDKITIGINQVYRKFPVRYVVRKEHRDFEKSYKEYPSGSWFLSAHNCGSHLNKPIDPKPYESYENLCIYPHTGNKHTLDLQELPKDRLVTSYSTITTGIHLAAYMGAKTVILVGHDCGTLDGKCNFTGYHTKETLFAWSRGEKDYAQWLPKIEEQTLTVKRLLLQDYRCPVYSLNPFINFGLEGHVYSKGVKE